jgi:adenosylhomocysteine nucleosidase
VLCALPEELGRLGDAVTRRCQRQGLELLELALGDHRLLAVVSGVGKVRAAQGASLLLSQGATRGLLVVGVCGGLRRDLVPGTLVHCSRTAQTDLAVRGDREFASDERLRAAWRDAAPGQEGWFLTADRPVLSLWRRLRLARAFLGPCVADMETAGAAAVAARAGVPWAALRAVTDGATGGALASFRRHYPSQAGRCADTLPSLLERLSAPERA